MQNPSLSSLNSFDGGRAGETHRGFLRTLLES